MQTHPGSPRSVDLSVVIVTYNCRSLVLQCLGTIPSAAAGVSYEVIVVDNASGDGTADAVHGSCPPVRVVANDRNLGFARGSNRGIALATGDFVLLLNPDTLAHPGAFRSTIDYLRSHPRAAAASCKVLRPDGALDPSCKRGIPGVWDAAARFLGLSRLFPRSRLLARYDAGHLDEDVTQEVELIDGCYMMMRRSALEDIGGLDERFFMYVEEMDWCRRAHDRGWSIGYAPSGSIVHIKGEITKRWTFRMLYHFHRSMALYCLKYRPVWNPVSWLVFAGIAVRFLSLTTLNVFRRERRVSG